MGITAAHQLSATSPDNTSYEIRPSHWNQSHLMTVNLTGSEISNAFSNANGVSFGLNGGGAITGSVASSLTNINFSAGANSANLSAIVFSNSNGVSFGLNGSTVTASAAAGGGVAVSAAGSSVNTGTAVWSNSNNVSFGMNGSTITGSASFSQSVQTQSLINASVGGNSTSAGAGYILMSSGTMTLAGGNNITLSQNGNAVTISGANAGGAQTGISSIIVSDATYTSGMVSFSNQANVTIGSSVNGGTQYIRLSVAAPGAGAAISAAGASASNGTVVFSNSNNVSFGMNGSTVTATITVPAQTNQSVGVYAVGNTTQSSSTTLDARTMSFGGRGDISVGVTGGTIQISGNQTNQSVGLYATGNTTQNSSTTLDARSMSINGLGGLTAGYSNGSIQLSVPGTSSLSATGIVSISVNGSTVSIGAGPLSVYAVSNTTQSSSGTIDPAAMSFAGAGGVSVGVSGSSIVISGGAGAGGVAASAAGASVSNGTVVWSNSNNVSFGMNGSTITATATFAQTNQSVGIYAVGNTTQSSSTTLDARTMSFGGRGAVSVGVTGATIQISAPTQTTQSAIEGFGASNTGNTAGNTGISTGIDFVLAGTNGITISQSTGAATNTLWISGITQTNQSAIKALGVSNTGNTAGNTGMSTGIDWVIAGSNNITISQSTAGGGPNTIWVSGPTAGAGGVAASAAGASASAGTVVWSNSNNVSFGMNGSTITATISVPAQTNQSVGLYALGNTTQNSSTTLDARTMSLNGLGAMTVGYSNGSIQLSAPASSSLSATGLVSISTNGSTISIGVPGTTVSAYEPFGILSGTAYSSHAPASWWFNRFVIDDNIAISHINVVKSFNASAPGATSQASTGTERFSYSHGITLFTRQDFAANSTNISAIKTGSWGMTAGFSYSSTSGSLIISYVTNSTGGTTSTNTTSNGVNWTNWLVGQRIVPIDCVTTLGPGEYWIAHAHSSTTGTTNSNVTLVSVSNLHIAPQNLGGVALFGTSGTQASLPIWNGGLASAVTTNNTMALSVVSASATQQNWFVAFSNA